MNTNSQATLSQGFTLLEMSIVLVIIAFVAAGSMVIFTQSLATRQIEETNAKLSTIQTALFNFRATNARLPCPADATLATTDSYFGIEGIYPGDCVTGAVFYLNGTRSMLSTFGPTANFTQHPSTGAQNTREGMVPTRALRLPDNYAYDSWGHRIMYVVTEDLTQVNAFNLYSGSDSTTRITIYNSLYDANGSSANNTTQAAYVLLSYGPNGQGSYPGGGGSTRLNAMSDNQDELINCYCTQPSSGAVAGASPVSPTYTAFVQKDPTLDANDPHDSFDDIVVYATRASLTLQPSFNWYSITPSANSMNCAPASLSCTAVGAVTSCSCNQ